MVKGNDIFYLFLNGIYLHIHLLQEKFTNRKKRKKMQEKEDLRGNGIEV